jgi:hypothetical protein
MNPIPQKNISRPRNILRKFALGMTSATLLISGTLLIAGIRSQASPSHTTTNNNTTTVDPTEKSAAVAVYDEMNLCEAGLDQHVFEMAMKGFEKLRTEGRTGSDSVLAIVDFTKPSRQKRLFVIDLKTKKLAYHTYVSHGKNSGLEYATRFSNKPSSHMSSLGFYVTRKTYQGSNGYSLQLDGCEKGVNDKALSRAIVMHAAAYASEQIAKGRGYIGRSFGCPAVPAPLHRPIIDKLKDGNVLFMYYPDQQYLQNSSLING